MYHHETPHQQQPTMQYLTTAPPQSSTPSPGQHQQVD